MNPKKYLENRIRGWLPKEPNLPIYQRTTRKTWHIQKRFVTLFLMGAFMGALFGALSSFTGLSGLGAYIYFMIIGTAMGIVAAAILIRIKRREEQQKS